MPLLVLANPASASVATSWTARVCTAGHSISATNNSNRQRFIDLIASVLHWCRADDGQRAGALRLNDSLSFGSCGAPPRFKRRGDAERGRGATMRWGDGATEQRRISLPAFLRPLAASLLA